MRTHGKITHWNDQKGYGFITPATGAKQVFVHIKAFVKKGHLPQVDQRVTFALSNDRQGRLFTDSGGAFVHTLLSGVTS